MMLRVFSCKMRMNIPQENGNKMDSKDGMCPEKDGIPPEGVICSASSGEHYKTAAIQCYQTESIPEDAGMLDGKIGFDQFLYSFTENIIYYRYFFDF